MSELEKIALELNYRVLYGKTFTALLKQFGPQFTSDIEDAVQNAFVRLMKSWGSSKPPEKLDAWLFITAKNDLLNQLKRTINKEDLASLDSKSASAQDPQDLRLASLLYIADLAQISEQAKSLFFLKNIFGLGVHEISQALLIGQEAIYKSSKRAATAIAQSSHSLEHHQASEQAIALVETILLAVFNMGFDSFDPKKESLVDEDLCLEAMALTQQLLQINPQPSTHHLLSLMCFHLARLEARLTDQRFVAFFDQDRSKWNKELIQLGFHHLKKPDKLNRYYLEALIISKYMGTKSYDAAFWHELIELYELLYQQQPSPIVQLNLCYALFMAKRVEEALVNLQSLENILPKDHTYLKLVKAEVLSKQNKEASNSLIDELAESLSQEVRRDFLKNKLKG